MASERATAGRADGGGSSRPRREIHALTGLRIVAAAWVLLFHFHYTPGESFTPYWQWLRPVVLSGALGVDLFFVLSGFVITLTYVDTLGPRPSLRATRSFLWARICRVWPVHALVTTLFGAWLVFKSTQVTDGYLAYQTIQPVVDLPHYVEQLLMVQLWHRPTYQGASFAGPAWSLSAEWLAYACFPLLALALWRLRTAPPLVTGLLSVGCLLPLSSLSVVDGWPGFDYAWLLRIAGGFCAGAFACLTVRRIPATAVVDRTARLVAGGSVLGIAAGLWWVDWTGAGSARGAVAVLFPVLVGALALSTGGVARLLGTRPMVHGGRISFALYLAHIPVFEIFWTEMAWHPRIAPGTALSTLATPLVPLVAVVLAHLLYRLVEEPGRRALRRREPGVRRRVPRTDAAVDVLPPATPAPSPSRPDAPVVTDGVTAGGR